MEKSRIMNKSKIAQIIDYVCLLLLTFILLRSLVLKFNLNHKLSNILIVFLTVVVFCTISKLLHNQHNQKLFKNLEQKRIDNIIHALKFGDPQKIKNFWIHALSKKFEVQTKSNHLTLKNKDRKIYFYYDFTSDEINLSPLVNAISKHPNKTICFCGTKFSKDTISLSSSNKFIKLLDTSKTLKLLENLNTIPTIKETEPSKRKFKETFLNSLSKKNFLRFVRYSLLLFFVSRYFPYKIYYLIFAIFLLILAFICLIKKSPQDSSVIVEL